MVSASSVRASHPDRSALPYGVLRPAAPADPTRPDYAVRLLRFLSAHPLVLRRGDLVLNSYGAFVGLGFGLASLLSASLIELRFGGQALSAATTAGIALSAYAGSRLVFALEREWSRLRRQSSICVRGHSLYGGIAGGVLFAAGSYRNDTRALVLAADCTAPAIALGYALGKLGCLSYGCCVGRPTTSRHSVCYSSPISRAAGQYGLGYVPLAPVQLYETALGLALAAGLTALPAGVFGTGRVIGAFLLVLGATRLPLLRLRYRLPDEHAGRVFSAGLSVAIAVIGGLLCAGVADMGDGSVATGATSVPGFLAASLLAACVALAAFGVHRLPRELRKEKNEC
jgi:phosphatidylglycerol:prolipoprotein diacylglycerol transferase